MSRDELQALLQAQGYLPETAISNRTVRSPFMEGLRGSVTGLMGSPFFDAPDLNYIPEGFWEKVQHGAGMLIGDAPAMVAGGAAGSPAGPVAAAAGAMALPEAAKQFLRAARFGTEVDPVEIGKAGLIGAATGGVGKLFAPAVTGATGQVIRAAGPLAKAGLMKMPAELATMTGVEAGLSGEVPTPGDIAANAVMMAGMHAAVKGIHRTVDASQVNRSKYDSMESLRRMLGVENELVNLGKSGMSEQQIYPAVISSLGKAYFEPGLTDHAQVKTKAETMTERIKSGGLGAQVEKPEIIGTGFVAGNKYYPTLDEAKAAIGKLNELYPEVPKFNQLMEAKAPELQALLSGDYLVKGKGFEWRPDKGMEPEGYIVGGKVKEAVFSPETYSPEAAMEWVNQHRNKLANDPKLFVSGQRTKEGNVFLNINEHFADMKDAWNAAADQRQLKFPSDDN